jgi:hypothetical protein
MSTIRLRRGSGAPTAGSFVEGEPAWDSTNGKLYVKNAAGSMVEIGGGAGGGTYTLSATPPTSPSAGDRWTDADDGITYVYLDDGDSSQWAELGPVGVTGPQGETGPQGPTGPKGVTLTNPTNSESLILLFTDTALTLSEIRSVVVGTTPSVTFSIRYSTDVSGSGTEVVASGITCTSTTTGLSTTSFTNGSIPANNFVWLTTSAVSGSVNTLHVTLLF